MSDPPARRNLAWDAAINPSTAWAELRESARTDDERACVAAAERQADRVWIALHTGRLSVSVETTTVPARNADWYRLALSAYDVMHGSGAYRHLGQLHPRACAAAEPILAAWLNGPSPSERDGPGRAADTVAESLGIGHAIHHINSETQVAHLSTVVNAAQDAGMFGVPDHRVDLVTCSATSGTGTAVRVVIDGTWGAAHASKPLELDTLLSSGRTGVDAITTALRRIADVATEVFANQARHVWEAPPADPSLDRVDNPTSRAFPDLRLPPRSARLDESTAAPPPGLLSPNVPESRPDDNGPSPRQR
jgi:hypothetical protein